MKIKILEYILFIKHVESKMTYDECWLLRLQCKEQAEAFYRKSTF